MQVRIDVLMRSPVRLGARLGVGVRLCVRMFACPCVRMRTYAFARVSKTKAKDGYENSFDCVE